MQVQRARSGDGGRVAEADQAFWDLGQVRGSVLVGEYEDMLSPSTSPSLDISALRFLKSSSFSTLPLLILTRPYLLASSWYMYTIPPDQTSFISLP